MVLQRKKNTSLLELLESYAGGSTLEVAIQSRPPTPFATYISHSKPIDKKRMRDKKGKDMSEEGKVVPSKELKPQKGAKIAKRAQKKPSAEGIGMEKVPERCPRVLT